MPKGIYKRPVPKIIFWGRVNKLGPLHPVLKTRCWEWQGTKLKCKNGNYGRLLVSKKLVLAHRYSYSINVGPIPDGLNVCHHCDNPTCVRPSHLFVGSPRDNADDRDNKGRQIPRKGEDFTHSKLIEEDVRFIRKNYIPRHPVFGSRAMARRFGVSSTVVKWVRQGRIWKHVDGGLPEPNTKNSDTRCQQCSKLLVKGISWFWHGGKPFCSRECKRLSQNTG